MTARNQIKISLAIPTSSPTFCRQQTDEPAKPGNLLKELLAFFPVEI
jgi:hypothetical protein